MISLESSSPSMVDGRSAGGLVQWLPEATALAAGVELVILRVFTRTAIHIPGFTHLRSVYVPIAEVGRSAFYVAAVLLIITLTLIVGELFRTGGVAARAGAIGVAIFLGAAALARMGEVDELTLDGVTLAALLLLAPWALGSRHGRSRLPAVLLVTTFVFSGLTGAEQAIAGSGPILAGTWLELGGEVLAVGAAIGAPLLVGRVRIRAALALGVAVGGRCTQGCS